MTSASQVRLAKTIKGDEQQQTALEQVVKEYEKKYNELVQEQENLGSTRIEEFQEVLTDVVIIRGGLSAFIYRGGLHDVVCIFFSELYLDTKKNSSMWKKQIKHFESMFCWRLDYTF